jgi:cysteine desulfurase
MEKPIYLDYNATTPLTHEVVVAMRPYLEEHFGNPSSSHPYGRITRAAVDQARENVAGLINAHPEEILFTSGGTESNNLAIHGAAYANLHKGDHIITTAIEHPAVTNVSQHLETRGYHITTLPVDSFGLVSPQDLKSALTPGTILVSIMHANNEVGTVEPIQELAEITHQAGALFHTDAAQSVGKLPVDVNDLGVDLLSIAGHKLYAPKGVGALYVRNGVMIEKISFGAGQEKGLRPGTENVLEIVGLGEAAKQASQNLGKVIQHMQKHRDQLQDGLFNALSPQIICLNGHPEKRLPNTLSVSFKNIPANVLLKNMQGVLAASAGAACHADEVRISSVIAAMGVPLDWAKGTIRLSVGRMTTSEEITRAVEIIIETASQMIVDL